MFCDLLIEAQVPFALTVYTLHVFFRQRVPEAGKFTQFELRELSWRSQDVLIPCERETEWQSSPGFNVYDLPVHVEIGASVVLVGLHKVGQRILESPGSYLYTYV